MGVGGQRHALAAFTPRKDPVPIVQEAHVLLFVYLFIIWETVDVYYVNTNMNLIGWHLGYFLTHFQCSGYIASGVIT
jgi:hypothetical protein